MNYLLDAHTLIWFLNGDVELSEKAISCIENLDNTKYVSIATLWEISIKLGLKKLEFDGGVIEITKLITANNFKILPILIEHIATLEKLDFIHRDPFDRMIIAQAIVDNMIILTRDENIHKYKVKAQWKN